MKLGFLTLAAVAYGARTPESQLASVKEQVTELVGAFTGLGSKQDKIAKKKKKQLEKTMDTLSAAVKKCTMEEVDLPADDTERSTDPCKAAGAIKRKITNVASAYIADCKPSMSERIVSRMMSVEKGVYNAMITTWFWVVMNKGLLIAFFGLGAMKGKRNVGSVYGRNALIPFTAAINFSTQVMVLYVHYAYAFWDGYYYWDLYYKCDSTCYNIRKASFGLAIVSLILSVVVIIDLIVASCQEPEPIPPPQNAVVPITVPTLVQQPVPVNPYPPSYQESSMQKAPYQAPVYTPTQPVIVPTTQYSVQPVPQDDPNTGRDLFNYGHIALMVLNAAFCAMIIGFLSGCLSY
ncbi:Oidioi.mRNA.OKI2018_I69.PAR.g11562.t1.cds [Oikopleura dioica]|uniref:Oidioi.mRNA.OKI2018_I69.PAR.g11562.t1.cds n=1 Tax=Oikopleura dioica TaxID=34765 RepID=A0ABN7S341_OIKDI|nr:Oidioi.mRNA.OKI2018_I69.PAR.g11562.t1.cds [Oikopleura dioica]